MGTEWRGKKAEGIGAVEEPGLEDSQAPLPSHSKAFLRYVSKLTSLQVKISISQTPSGPGSIKVSTSSNG